MTSQTAITRMLSIADEIGKRYHTRAALSLRDYQLSQDAEARRVYMTPPDGWPGKNAEQRDTAKLAAELQDETLQKIAAELAGIKGEASVNNAAIDALEAERRALEWGVRAQLVDALSSNQVQPESDGKVETAAFDDTLDAKSLEQAEQAIAEVDAVFETEAELDAQLAMYEAEEIDRQPVIFEDEMPF